MHSHVGDEHKGGRGLCQGCMAVRRLLWRSKSDHAVALQKKDVFHELLFLSVRTGYWPEDLHGYAADILVLLLASRACAQGRLAGRQARSLSNRQNGPTALST